MRHGGTNIDPQFAGEEMVPHPRREDFERRHRGLVETLRCLEILHLEVEMIDQTPADGFP